ncbi:YxeA family protein [Kurthia senegalensis]|uniref:YxeA family protein n=1 Tax=Kurthia senegalensis TaxID=1033740 RepID=UPI000288E21F|nr:YxeA family protein [Kurthia senegalensis]
MKKFLITIGLIFVVCCAGIYALMTIDFNRMNTSEYYVKITQDGIVTESKSSDGKIYKDYNYSLEGINEDGKKKTLDFFAQKNLRKGAYLKMYVKEKGVSSYDEVKFDELPKKAQEFLK